MAALTFGGIGFAGIVLWFIVRTVYRVFIHPLAKFPGPKLAAISTWYEGYYDVIAKPGRFTWELGRLHNQYGPIVRIGPNEVHINDPSYYNTLYSMSNHRVDKYDWFYTLFGNPTAAFGTVRWEIHKVRRGAINPFFSAQAVAQYQPRVQQMTDQLCNRMAVAFKTNEPVPLFFAYRSLTVDIISDYLFGKPLGQLERDDWGESFYAAWRTFWEMSPLIRQWPWMMTMFRILPPWLLSILMPKAREVMQMEVSSDELTKQALGLAPNVTNEKVGPTIMWKLAHSPTLPPKEKTFRRLAVEAHNDLAAGFETTGGTLAHITFGILSSAEVHCQLKIALEEAIPDPTNIPSWQTLERIPYLRAVVKEGIRVGVGVYARLPRVNRSQVVRYKDWTIPSGTAVGMSNFYVEMNPRIFPEPESFKPERWLEPDAREKLEPYLVAFGKGPRGCLGINLAYAELYTVIATLFRRFPYIKLFESKPGDAEVVAEHFIGLWRYEKGKPGLRVVS